LFFFFFFFFFKGFHCCCLFVGGESWSIFVVGRCVKLEGERHWVIDSSFFRAIAS
jgi:hypothetical protein